MEDEELLAYKGSVLRRSDLDILNAPCYLTDEIIGFYFSYLSSLFTSVEILLIPPSVSFWLTNSKNENLFNIKDFMEPMKLGSRKLVFFPVNDNGTHWSLLVYDKRMNSFVHHDSIKGANHLTAMKLYEQVKDIFGMPNQERSHKKKIVKNRKIKASSFEVPSFIEADTPQQMNGYDCGLYVMAIARTICQWQESDSRAKDWFTAMEENVTGSVELTMRNELIGLIEDLRTQRNCFNDAHLVQ